MTEDFNRKHPNKIDYWPTQGQEGFALEEIAELIVGIQNQVWTYDKTKTG